MQYTKKRYNINIIILAISSSLFLLRSNIPLAIYLLSLIQFIAIINIFKKTSFYEFKHIIKHSFRSFHPYYLIIFFFIVAFLNYNKKQEIIKELINIAFLLSYIILFIIELDSYEKFNKFKQYFLLSFTSLFTVYLFISFIISLHNSNLLIFLFPITGSAGSFDRNLYSLNLWISIITIFYYLNKIDNKIYINGLNILISVLLILVILSSSRRGISILLVFSIIFIIYLIFDYKKQNTNYKKFSFVFVFYYSILVLVTIFVTLPGNIRSNIFDNTINNPELKNEFTKTTYRYFRLVKPEISLSKYKKIFWDYKLENYILKDTSIEKRIEIINKEYQRKNYTKYINLLQGIVRNTDSLDLVIKLLPEGIKDKLQKKDKDVFKYLPEILKLPYVYTNFFSCTDISNLHLKNYYPDNNKYLFCFSFRKDSAHINLTLPALANSEYELSFNIVGKTNIVDKLILKDNLENITFKKNFTQDKDTLSYSYIFKIKENKNNILKSVLLLQNNTNSFKMSDINWKLIKTQNKELEENIYKKAKIHLKKFKYKQNRLWLWNYYFKAEKLTESVEKKKYSKNNIVNIFKRITQGVHAIKYVATKVSTNNDTIIFNSKNEFPRAKFDLPLIQNTIYKLEVQYTHKTKKDLITYFNRSPDIFNVYLKYKILKDSTYKLSDNKYKNTIEFYVDSINSTTALFVFGLKNIRQDDTLIINKIDFKPLITPPDSIWLSKAQYTNLNTWAKKVENNNLIIALNKKVKYYENKDLWQIDSSIYHTPFADRMELWIFAWKYFQTFPLYKKIFGDSFNYYQMYKLRFGKGKRFKGDYYPHNPIISTILYSGILGVLAYLYFTFYMFYYYYIYKKEIGVFILLFLLILLYSYISGKSHFTITYFILFSIFPFLINFINNKNIKT